MKEIVIISGNGGTGKASLFASFAALAGNAVLVDCDMDAVDLHRVLAPTLRHRGDLRCGREAEIRQADCIGCGACLAQCRFGAVVRIAGINDGFFSSTRTSCKNCADVCVRSCPAKFADMIDAMKETSGRRDELTFVIDPSGCEGCGECVSSCPVKAIELSEELTGEWCVSDTRHGPMVHARLITGSKNSGKLASKIRQTARTLAEERNIDLILVHNPPGVGGAVTTSARGASLVLIVTEPTLAGIHHAEQVLALTRHFGIPTAICTEKWDLDPDMTARIEAEAHRTGASVAGRMRCDRDVGAAQLQGLAIVETDAGPIGEDIRSVWRNLQP